jgi:uncharacterized membrane protein
MSATNESLGARKNLWSGIGWVLLLAGALLAAGNALMFATLTEFTADYGSSGDFSAAGQKARMFTIPAIGYAHTLGGMVAMLIGPFQFLASVRRHYPALHRWLGRVYLTSVALGGLAGLYLSPGSYASNTFGIAFIALALAWLYTGTQAYLAIRTGDVATHRRWMIRNYALTYAAVTLRIEMPLLIVLGGLSPIIALNIVGWLCWVPNLLLVEAWFRKKRTAPALAQQA